VRFLTKFLFFNFLIFLIWCGLIFGEANKPTAMSQWIFDAYEKKEKIAKKIKEKKIVILAGSNALFGVNSRLISKEFGMRVVNYGVNAGVELPYTLHAAKKVISPGDIVIMPLEYPMYSYEATPGVQMIDYILSREASFFLELSLREQFYILWHVSFKRVFDGYFNQSENRVTSGLYGAHHIDSNGDQIETALKYKTPNMFAELDALKANRYGAEFDADAVGWEYLEKFVKWCEAKSVKLIFMPSTLMKKEKYFNDSKERWFYENIANEVRERGWLYVGEPYRYMYEKEMYFNTDFHLINRGRELRTLQMVKDLKGNI